MAFLDDLRAPAPPRPAPRRVNVEPTAEIPRAVTAENSTLGSSSPLGQRVDAGLLQHVPRRVGQLELDDDAPQRRDGRQTRRSTGPPASATAPAGWWAPSIVTPVARPSSTRAYAASPTRSVAPASWARSANAFAAAAGGTGRPVSSRHADRPSASAGSSARSSAPSR